MATVLCSIDNNGFRVYRGREIIAYGTKISMGMFEAKVARHEVKSLDRILAMPLLPMDSLVTNF